MSTKDISDLQVVQAVDEFQKVLAFQKDRPPREVIHDILLRVTGECGKVCVAALDRAARRGLYEKDSLSTPMLTDKGKELLATAPTLREPKMTVTQVLDRNTNERVGVAWIEVPPEFAPVTGNYAYITLFDEDHWEWNGAHWSAKTDPPRMDRIQFFMEEPSDDDRSGFASGGGDVR